VDWIHLILGMDQWRALVITVTNLRVSQNENKVLTYDKLLASQEREGICFMESA
jgi:hypothetical protein